jgi:hypothetical protein
MLTAASAKKYTNPEFLLHAVLILWAPTLDKRCRLWCQPKNYTGTISLRFSFCSTRKAINATSSATPATAALPHGK